MAVRETNFQDAVDQNQGESQLRSWEKEQKEIASTWNEWVNSPEGKAREKVHDALVDLSNDPDVLKSRICVDFINLAINISPADVGADTLNELLEPIKAYFNKLNASMGAAAKLSKDPKQQEKALVRECWGDWQNEPTRYKGNATFARDMLQKFETLTSQPVIERWCRDWQKESDTQQAK